MKPCTKCGHALNNEETQCSKCGLDLEAVAPKLQTPPTGLVAATADSQKEMSNEALLGCVVPPLLCVAALVVTYFLLGVSGVIFVLVMMVLVRLSFSF